MNKTKKMILNCFEKYLLIAVICCSVILIGCDSQAGAVSFYNITSARSQDATVDIKFNEEKDYKNTYVDVLIKPSEDNLVLKAKKEYTNFADITLSSKDTWYSLTILINRANGTTVDGYQKYQDASEWIYIFNCDKNASVTLKAVNGGVEPSTEGGFLLVNRKDISDEFKLNIRAKTE